MQVYDTQGNDFQIGEGVYFDGATSKMYQIRPSFIIPKFPAFSPHIETLFNNHLSVAKRLRADGALTIYLQDLCSKQGLDAAQAFLLQHHHQLK